MLRFFLRKYLRFLNFLLLLLLVEEEDCRWAFLELLLRRMAESRKRRSLRRVEREKSWSFTRREEMWSRRPEQEKRVLWAREQGREQERKEQRGHLYLCSWVRQSWQGDFRGRGEG